MEAEGKKEKIIGIALLVVLILVVVILYNVKVGNKTEVVYGAVGGGKDDFLKDEDFVKRLEKEYKIKFEYDNWSNGKTVREPVVRSDGSNYDLIFFSDQRFYDYYKTPARENEAKRQYVNNGGLTLNTPIVIYSWDVVVDALIKENIVTEQDGVYYITDMNKLIDYILQGKRWSDIGLNDIYGQININSTDPVTSSPGATYYGLLLSIMSGGDVNNSNIRDALPKLKRFYEKSGYMNNTPKDLFELYLKTGVGSKPMIVDYEKSIIEFKNSNPKGYAEVKDKIRILYPTPTIWNSHCIATFTDNGDKFLKAFEDEEVQDIAWSKYGFRVGITGGNYDTKKIGIKGIPKEIKSTTSGLKMDVYNELIDYLKN